MTKEIATSILRSIRNGFERDSEAVPAESLAKSGVGYGDRKRLAEEAEKRADANKLKIEALELAIKALS